jgi:hypothetical protein
VQFQVLTAPWCVHNARGRVPVPADKQVSQFVRDDPAQNHFCALAPKQFRNAVRINVGGQSKAFVDWQKRVPENVRAKSPSICGGVREESDRKPCGCIRKGAGLIPDFLLRSMRANPPYCCDANPLKNSRSLLLGPSQCLRGLRRAAPEWVLAPQRGDLYGSQAGFAVAQSVKLRCGTIVMLHEVPR